MIEMHWLEAVLLVLLGMHFGAAVAAWTIGRMRRRRHERRANAHLAEAERIYREAVYGEALNER